MAANKIIKGRDLMLFDNDGHSYAYATNHTLTITAETVDISSKDHGIWGASEVANILGKSHQRIFSHQKIMISCLIQCQQVMLLQ